MSFLQTIILGIVQGITEFIPISSSGHLNLFQYFFSLTPSLTLDIFLNTATFFSVLFYFRKKINYFFKNLPYIIVGTIPAIIIGLFFKDQVDSIFSQIKYLPFFYLITAFLLIYSKFLSPKDHKINYKSALIIGIFQAIAILPGVSRSGSTIFAALLVGLSSTMAFNFSFALFIPASLGALILALKDVSDFSIFTSSNYLITFFITIIVGIISLFFLQKIVTKNKLWIFGFYCLALSLVSIKFIFY